MTTYGLETVVRPQPLEDDYEEDDGEIIDVVNVHGLSNLHEEIWRSEEDARQLVRSLFGWRDSALRLSVYRYRPVVSPASVLVSHGIRQEASRLLKAIADLKDADTKTRRIVFLAHDFGAAIVKQALYTAAFGDAPLREVFSSTRVMILFGCCENLGPDREVQEFFSQLLRNDTQFQGLAPRYSDHGLALARGLTEVNYCFLDTAALYRGVAMVSVWSKSDLDSNYGAFSFYASSVQSKIVAGVAYAELLRDTPLRDTIYTNVQRSLALPSRYWPWRNSGPEIQQKALEPLSGQNMFRDLRWVGKASQLDISCIVDDPLYSAWQAGRRRAIPYVRVSHPRFAGLVIRQIQEQEPLAFWRWSFIFEFRDWDVRHNSVETFLLQFLVTMVSGSLGPRAGEVSYSEDLADGMPWAWSPDMIFQKVAAALRYVGTAGMAVTWFLANLDDNIISYHWFMKSIGALLENSDIPLKILVVNAKGPPSTLTSPPTIVLKSPVVRSGPAGMDDKRQAPESPTTDITGETTRDGASFQTLELAAEVVRLLERQPSLYAVRHALNDVFTHYTGDDPEMRELIYSWFLSLSTEEPQLQLEASMARLSAYSPSAVFQAVLEYTLSDTEGAKQAKWVLEIVAHAVRPLTVFEVEDLDQLLSEFNTAIDIPKLKISKYGSSLHGLITIVNHEVHFGHPMLRDFLLAGPNSSPLALGEASVAAQAHARIAIACLEYISSAKALGLITNYTDKAALSESSSFLESSRSFLWYAVRNWPEHAKLSNEAFSEQKEYVQKLIERDILDTWATLYSRLPTPASRPCPSGTSAIAMLAGCGLSSLIDALLELRPGPLPDEELIQAVEQAAKAGEAKVVRKLMGHRSSNNPIPLKLITASVPSRNEALIIELFELTSKEDDGGSGTGESDSDMDESGSEVEDGESEMAKAFASAACYGLATVMRTLLPHLPMNPGWSRIAQYASLGGNVNAIELVYNALLARRNSATLKPVNVRRSSRILEKALTTALRHGISDIVAFLTERKCTVIQEADGTADNDDYQGTSWSWIFARAMATATRARQSNALATLLASTGNLPKDYLEKDHLNSINGCIDLAFEKQMLSCSRCLFEHLASQMPTEELRLVAKRYLNAAATLSHQVSILDLVLGFAGRQLKSDELSDLWSAIPKVGDECIPLLEYLLDNYESVWSENERQRHLGEALCTAADLNENKVASFLLERGANPDYSTPGTYLRSPMYSAVDNGNEELVEKFISKNANVNARIPSDSPEREVETWPLITTAAKYPAVFRIMLKAGADVNVTLDRPDLPPTTPLLEALAFSSSHESAKILIEKKCDVNVFDGNSTPLSIAVHHGRADMVQLLLDSGADPTLQPPDKLEYPLIHLCVGRAYPDILKMLLLYDMTINAPDDQGFYPLHWTFDDTTPEVVKLLLDRGSPVDITGGTHNITPLGQAVTQGNLEVIKYLTSVGANVNHKERDDLTALHRSCYERWATPDIVRYLLESGADINAVSTAIHGTPFQATLQRQAEETASIIRLLLDNDNFLPNAESPWWGANINAACLGMDLGVVEELLQAGVKVDLKDKAGRQSIHFAAYRDATFVQRLVKAGASLDAKDAMGRTVLHVAVLGGHLDLVKYILQERKDFVNARDANDWTPLLWAMGDWCRWGVDFSRDTRTALIEELLACGASRIAQGHGHDRSWTALKLARYLGLEEDIIKLVTPSEDELKVLDPSEQSRWRHEIDETDEEGGVSVYYSVDCDFCLATMRGFYYYCDDCDNDYGLCFRCYRSQRLVHPGHDFHREGYKEYQSNSESGSIARSGTHSRSSSHGSSNSDGSRGSDDESQRSGAEDEESGEEDSGSEPEDDDSDESEDDTSSVEEGR